MRLTKILRERGQSSYVVNIMGCNDKNVVGGEVEMTIQLWGKGLVL